MTFPFRVNDFGDINVQIQGIDKNVYDETNEEKKRIFVLPNGNIDGILLHQLLTLRLRFAVIIVLDVRNLDAKMQKPTTY